MRAVPVSPLCLMTVKGFKIVNSERLYPHCEKVVREFLLLTTYVLLLLLALVEIVRLANIGR